MYLTKREKILYKESKQLIKKKTAASALSGITEIPADALSALPNIHILGNNELVINGGGDLLEYNEGVICLQCGKMLLSIHGDGFIIHKYINAELTVSGFITDVSFS